MYLSEVSKTNSARKLAWELVNTSLERNNNPVPTLVFNLNKVVSVICFIEFFVVAGQYESAIFITLKLISNKFPPVFHNLSATMFSRSSSRTDIASVEPLDVDPVLKCSSQALVSGKSKLPYKATAIISAEDESRNL